MENKRQGVFGLCYSAERSNRLNVPRVKYTNLKNIVLDEKRKRLTLTTIFMSWRWKGEDKEWSGEMEGMNYRE